MKPISMKPPKKIIDAALCLFFSLFEIITIKVFQLQVQSVVIQTVCFEKGKLTAIYSCSRYNHIYCVYRLFTVENLLSGGTS